MLSGDLSTYPLPDLLQWADASRVSGTLTVERAGVATWLRLHDREVVSISPPPDVALPMADPASNALPPAPLGPPATASDRLVDLFMGPDGHFILHTGPEEPDAGIPVRVAIRVLVMEALRHLDELPRLLQSYPADPARLVRTREPASPDLAPVLQALLLCASRNLSLGETRMRVGLSRPALLRRVDELVGHRLVQVEGAHPGADPVAKLIAQASVLVRERQFDEAAIVFSALLAADPSDARVRRLLTEAEREHVATLYRELDPLAVVHLAHPQAARAPGLSHADREVAERVNGRWDVGTLVLSSPLREAETLKSIKKLARAGLVLLARPASPR
jgi:DNA-binding Lrp family transcriptional regulator